MAQTAKDIFSASHCQHLVELWTNQDSACQPSSDNACHSTYITLPPHEIVLVVVLTHRASGCALCL